MPLAVSLMSHLPLRTARLQLTPLDLSHLPALAAMLADPVVMRYFPRAMSSVETEGWLRRTIGRYQQHGTGLLAVLGPDGPAAGLIGDCGLQVRSIAGHEHLELGYHFTRSAWGRGYATEAARACLALAFAHTQVPDVIALIRPENGPSQGVARRLGMRPGRAVLHGGLVHDVWRVDREGFAEDALQ